MISSYRGKESTAHFPRFSIIEEMMIQNPKDFKLGAGLSAFCLFLMLFLIPNQVGTFSETASLLPMLISVFLLGLSLLLMLRAFRTAPARVDHRKTGTPWPTQAGVVVIMIAYAWLLDVLGFLVTSLLCLVALFLTFGVKDFRKIAIITSITVIVLYVSFEKLLHAPLPMGTLIEPFLD